MARITAGMTGISREVSNAALKLADAAGQQGYSREGAISTAVEKARAQFNLSMLEQLRLQAWLDKEFKHRPPSPKASPPGGAPASSTKSSDSPRKFGFRLSPQAKKLLAMAKLSKHLLGREMVFLVTVFLLTATVMRPPWRFTVNRDGTILRMDAGYASIKSPPTPDIPSDQDPNNFDVEINKPRLAFEWVTILAIATISWFQVPKLKIWLFGRKR